MKVKFCGLRRREDIEGLEHSCGDYAGFVFARSKRRIGVDLARELVSSLPVGVVPVGVFQDQSLEEVAEIAESVGLEVLQLHGKEDGDYIQVLKERTGLEVWKAFPCTEEGLESARETTADKVLIDSPQGGGSGVQGDWALLSGLQGTLGKPWFLAGGLNPMNLEEALAILTPFGVDVSGGIEEDGVKDLGKMQGFCRKARK